MLLASEPFVCSCLLRTSCFLFNFRYHSCSQRRLSRAFSLADLFLGNGDDGGEGSASLFDELLRGQEMNALEPCYKCFSW
jgi:hypothetical protein